MPVLDLVIAPNPIFKKKADPVLKFDEELRQLTNDMLETIYFEHAVGMGANMVGVLKRIAVVDLQTAGVKDPYILINPEITWRSSENQTHEEASICFPGIAAEITRALKIKVTYQDENGHPKELDAEGPLATVIQHELDYLDGKVFLDYLSKFKRDFLIKKMQKFIKMHPPHVHGPGCNHHH
jgi:peptide deformylase